jgi:arylsulfatase A-like enzyme
MPRTLLAFVLFLSAFVAGIAAANDPSRPNILVIFADDMGWKGVGFDGDTRYETPHLDALAKQAMVFPMAYASSGNCAPSRACLWSGEYTPRHEVYAVHATDRGPKQLMRLIPIPNKVELAPEKITIAESLRAAGYRTGLFGKWHLGEQAPYRPTDQGFDVFVAAHQRTSDVSEDPKSMFSLSRAALKFMEEDRSRPFFAFIAHHAIHTPLAATAESVRHFEQKSPGLNRQDVLYAASTLDLDNSVGMVMARLRELGLEENTLVIFTSDNGGTQQSSQEPLRGNKGCYYEGGIRVPFFARWPGHIAPGVNATPVTNIDFYPTFLSLAKAPAPNGYPLDGANLMPLFTGKVKGLDRALFWHFPGYLDDPVIRGRDPVFRTRPVTVVRQGDWKLHLYHEEWFLDGGREKLATNHAVELYNLSSDPGERHDLANVETARRDALLATLLNWGKATNAKFAHEPNPGYNPNIPIPVKKGRGKNAAKEG